ncbi:hypothetical protein ASPZODRAFT_135951 [Penicilliopsis zonata CBS 506.65]|uniref:C2H2-type domain-containing protein n=1 Tax=Penicilliopsis zonata CBS 506.65 TaxID=1073090 RepID=A0A1L9S9Q0_9EURO|nr:hypothetical protein ASPZODRAFT_135951 [Penicilliopsis zonata CBS 506.65]OJJ43912.1 hypothetical protein ASPZODRAFT_135951 [Penicilliopsis zonata CBS 506.65]
MKAASDKHFRCTVCQRGFTRIDHLKRHHLRHSGLKPYSCVFCAEAFARCDNLRDHYADCSKRGDRKIPETGQRGRRRHACQSCTSMKLRCDGESPCSSCLKRGLECNNHRNNPVKEASQSPSSHFDLLNSRPDAVGSTGMTSGSQVADEDNSDRGSIKFLLNAGTDSFTEHFQLPPRSDLQRRLIRHNDHHNETAREDPLQTSRHPPQTKREAVEENSDSSSPFYQDDFINFFSGPFADVHKSVDDPLTGAAAYRAGVPPVQDPNLTAYEPERPFASALTQAIRTRAWTLPLDNKARDELSMNLGFLLTTTRIRKFAAMYFKYWHTSCPITHAPSFDLETAPMALLVAVVFMGAMYSNDEKEAYVARRVLDFAEFFIFSNDTFSSENEICTTFSGTRVFDGDIGDWTQFQNLQAGVLMVILQYWAGNPVSRNRALENRFSEVVKVARKIGLTSCQHTSQNSVSEYIWIQTESRIRTINVISLVDCSFSLFRNYPCRLIHTEMNCDLPCEEHLFRSPHPFSDRKFKLSRNITISEAFQNLFEKYPKREPPDGLSYSLSQSPRPAPDINPLQLTVFDMFVMIHVLYAFINTHMTHLVPFMRSQASTSSSQSQPYDIYTSTHRPSSQLNPDDPILASIRTALSRWREIWFTLQNQMPHDKWVTMGIYRNGYNFWLVAQLLITKKASIDVIMQMEVKCEDKLQKLKVLLQDENE